MSTDTPDPLWTLLAQGSWAQVGDLTLLLGSQFLPYRLEHLQGVFYLYIPPTQMEHVQQLIVLFQRENPPKGKTDLLPSFDPRISLLMLPPLCGTAWGVFAGQYEEWKQIGLANAQAIRHGEWFRAITALTLHADSGHLFSNLLAAMGFSYFLQRHLSIGAQSLIIVIAGLAANTTEALILNEHHSLGFSTATFAMMGLLVSMEMRRSLRSGLWQGKEWKFPLFGGLLLAWETGIAPDVDVLAHGLGLLWGLFLGTFWTQPLQPQTKTQWPTLLISWAIYLGAWVWAVMAFQGIR